MEINQDWIELLQAFMQNEVQFLIVGGHAVSAYGYARYTEDLDVFVAISEENSSQILAALKQFFGTDVGELERRQRS